MGLDLVDFFRGKHSWRKLTTILARLPSWSAYWEAQANDDDYAEFVLSLPEGSGAPRPPALSEFTPEVSRLTDVSDQMNMLIALVMQALGGKPPKQRMSPRPVTAVDRLRSRRERAEHDDFRKEIEAAQARWIDKHGK